jgi:integrase
MGIYQRKDSPYWWYKWTPLGTTKPVVGSTDEADKVAAQAIYEKIRTEFNKGKHFGKAIKIKLTDLRDRYLDLYRKQKWFPQKSIGLATFLAAPRIAKLTWANEVTREDVLWYKVWRSDFVKQSTVNRELGIVRHMYNVANEDMGMRLENPFAKIEMYSEKKFRRFRHMLADEKARFFADPLTPQRIKDVVLFDIKTGLRQGELRDLKLPDIDFETGLVRVVAGDEDSTRFVPLRAEVVDVLKRWVGEAKRLRSQWVFHNEDGAQLSRHGWVVTAFEWACKRLKIANLHFHDLRHTFASDFIMAGGDFKTLAEYLGHSTTVVTERYAHLTPKYKAAQIMLLPAELPYAGGEMPSPEVTQELRRAFRSQVQGRKKAVNE